MSGSKHDKQQEGETAFASDLDRNPGIGQSPGSFATGERPELIEGENSVEGDTENDPTAQGAILEDQVGRTNK